MFVRGMFADRGRGVRRPVLPCQSFQGLALKPVDAERPVEPGAQNGNRKNDEDPQRC
jgi:hypothetical protein